MFGCGYRTPAKDVGSKPTKTNKTPDNNSPKGATGTSVAQARRSIESQLERVEETGGAGSARQRPRLNPTDNKAIAKKTTTTASSLDKSPKRDSEYLNRTSEAKACLIKLRLQINNSRNLKTEIKNEVIEAADRLYKLVRDAEEDRAYREGIGKDMHCEKQGRVKPANEQRETGTNSTGQNDIVKKLEEHAKLLNENKEEMMKLNEEMKKHREEWLNKGSYANVLAAPPKNKLREPTTTMHSIVVTSVDQADSGEDVFEKIRKRINAKEEGLKVDSIRKAKDRKVIIGCRTKEELGKIKEKIRKAEGELNMEDVKNKQPLIILKYVLSINSDEDIIKALKSQNEHLLGNLSDCETEITVKYRRRTRNPHVCHVVLQVPTTVWRILIEAASVHIDIQRVRVEDQSPLVQCSRCLGFGHGKRFCRDQTDACSHCGGPHHRSDCPDWVAQVPPTCCNCIRAKLSGTDHNAFSAECPVRKKWETLARSTVAYC